MPEWAYGVTNWFEAGLYLPLYTHDKTLGFGIDGFKLRTLFAVPHGDDRRFVYGANFEFSVNAKRWDTKRITSEIRPILGWHLSPKFDVIVNPIVDTAYDGLKNLEFVPSVADGLQPVRDAGPSRSRPIRTSARCSGFAPDGGTGAPDLRRRRSHARRTASRWSSASAWA